MKKEHCFKCGNEINLTAGYCPKCGAKQSSSINTVKNKETEVETKNINVESQKQSNIPNDPYTIQKPTKQKNPILAAFLSFIIVGLGQIYNVQLKRGLLLLLGAIISFFLFIIYIGVIFFIIIWIYAIYDAYNTAKRINDGEIIN